MVGTVGMKLKVIGSGSSGNCYLLDDGRHVLVIEAGLPFKEVKEAIDYETSRIVGVLSSHEHGDHRKYLCEYEAAFIPVMKGNRLVEHVIYEEIEEINDGGFCKFGNYHVFPFAVVHDVPCYGYQIHHPDMGRLVFVTDTEYLKYRFPGVNHIMVEANYAQDILDENMNAEIVPKVLRDRIMKSHMSIETAKGIVKANKNPMLANVILLHLSRQNSDKKRFREEVQEIAGPLCKVTIAEKGVEVSMDLVPF